MKKLGRIFIVISALQSSISANIFDIDMFKEFEMYQYLDKDTQNIIAQQVVADILPVKKTSTLPGHTNRINHLAWSPQNTHLASASRDRTVKIWDTTTQQEVLTLKGHESPVYAIAWGPTEDKIASCSEDKSIIIWDVATARDLATLYGHTDVVYSVAWSPDGKKIASGSEDKKIKIWDAETFIDIATLDGHTGSVNVVAWSPDGNTIISGSNDGTIKIWDAHTFKEIATLKGPTAIYALAYSADGKKIASGSQSNTITLWDANTFEKVDTLPSHNNVVSSLAWGPQSSKIASASWDNTVQICDVYPPKEKFTLQECDIPVYCVAWSSDDKIAAGSNNDTIKLWYKTSLITPQELNELSLEQALFLHLLYTTGKTGLLSQEGLEKFYNSNTFDEAEAQRLFNSFSPRTQQFIEQRFNTIDPTAKGKLKPELHARFLQPKEQRPLACAFEAGAAATQKGEEKIKENFRKYISEL